MELLGKGEVFEITAVDGIARLEVVNRPDVTPEEGARCASEMNDIITNRVLAPRSGYRALLVDVRRGPPVFGPNTRAALGDMFAKIEDAKKATAVLVGTPAIQRLQFSSLVREHARTTGKVFGEEEQALAWLERHADG